MHYPDKIRILLLDGPGDYASKLRDSLAMNYEVCLMHSGENALRFLAQVDPDLILLDPGPPGVKGFHFIRTVHRNPGWRKTPFLFLSENPSEVDMRLGNMLNAVQWLNKGDSISSIATCVALVVEDYRLTPQGKAFTLTGLQEFLRQQPPPKTANQIAHPPPAQARKLRLLLAHRQHPLMAVVESDLSAFCDCILASSGMEAVHKACAYLPDVFVLGLHLHQMMGFRVCETLKSNQCFKDAAFFGIRTQDEQVEEKVLSQCGMSRIFLLPNQQESLRLAILEIYNNQASPRHRYPQSFDEVQEEEERLRLQTEKIKGDTEHIRRMQLFEDFFRENK